VNVERREMFVRESSRRNTTQPHSAGSPRGMQLSGKAESSGNKTNVGFPGHDGPSEFWAVMSQVSQGWDMNVACRWSHFTSLINCPKNSNKIDFLRLQIELGLDTERLPRILLAT